MKKSVALVLVSSIVGIATGALIFAHPGQPLLPFSVSFRRALVGHAYVAQIHNNSNMVHKVVVSMESPTTQNIVRRVEVIGPGKMAEIGWLEGWAFVPGESLDLHESGFRDLQVDVSGDSVVR